MKLLIIVSIFLLSSILGAQNASIIGVVKSENSTLPFATIQIKNLQKGTTTDLVGEYNFNDLPYGDYTLITSFVGYISQKKTITISESKEYELNFDLTSNSLLEEVVVSGTMKTDYVSKSPIKIDVITSKKLDLYLPAAASSVIENVQLINGVQEVIACGVCYTNSISVNGLEGSYTAILMDGTPIYGSLASVYGLNGIPNMIIDRIEVIKGPSSTLYGSEAVAGVINIITKKPENQPKLSVDLMGSTHEEVFTNIAYAPSIGKSNAYIGLNYGHANNYEDNNNDGFGDAIHLDRISLFSKFNFYRKSDKPFTLAAKYYYEDRRNGVELFLKDNAYKNLRGSDKIYGESIYTNRTELFGSYVFNFDANIKLDYSFSNHLQDSFYGSDYYKASQQVGYTNFIWNFTQKKHDVLTGATLRFDGYDDNTVATEEVLEDGIIVNKPNNQFVPGIFVQDEFTVSNKFTALGGFRIDYHNNHGFIFAPRLNLKYKSSEWSTFRMNFGTGFKVVNLFTEDHAFVSGQREVEIAENLNPEKSYNTSLNYNQVYVGLGGSGNLDFEGFYTYFSNKIIPDYETPGKIIYSNSDGYAQSYGFAVNVNHNFRFPLALNMGINYLETTETEIDNQGNKDSFDLLFAPKWSGTFSLNYTLKKQNLTFAYTAQYTGVMALPTVYDLDETGTPLLNPRSQKSQPFSLHQIQITKVFNNNYSLYVGSDNLFNFIQTESPLVGHNDPNYEVGFSPYFDTSYAYAPNHGRELYVGFKWNVDKNRPQNSIVER